MSCHHGKQSVSDGGVDRVVLVTRERPEMEAEMEGLGGFRGAELPHFGGIGN